jgi:hypothetical protein
MKYAPAVTAVAVAASMMSCVRTSEFASEYSQQYYLREDVNQYSTHAFTGFYSVWFTGPEKVETICSATIPVAGATVLKKGCRVRVLKLFKISAVDASYSDAKLQIVDTASQSTHIVYVTWPASKSLLTTESPAPREH